MEGIFSRQKVRVIPVRYSSRIWLKTRIRPPPESFNPSTVRSVWPFRVNEASGNPNGFGLVIDPGADPEEATSTCALDREGYLSLNWLSELGWTFLSSPSALHPRPLHPLPSPPIPPDSATHLTHPPSTPLILLPGVILRTPYCTYSLSCKALQPPMGCAMRNTASTLLRTLLMCSYTSVSRSHHPVIIPRLLSPSHSRCEVRVM